MGRLEGNVAIVTGASAGIGRATALAFAGEGAAVTLADVDGARGTALAKEIAGSGGRARFVATDVADDAQVEAMVRTTVEELGGLDFAFNNAGIEGAQAPTDQSARENWDRVIAVNLTGVWSSMRHEIPAMLAGGGGVIVNCSSVAGLVGFPGIGPYVAAKHGVIGLTKVAALEYATAGIRVNAVCPGVVDTEMIDRFTHGDPVASEQLLATEPVGRMGTPDEIADAVIWLCSPGATFVTGVALPVDGGFVAR
jgi:NAD(P)-dependent dehydrogenase (short-subunit alcohol dehydrogenase family)